MTTPRSKTTLTDVAKLAGVSATTVSYVLNDRSEEMRIAEATQQRVREAVDTLGYRPNHSARSLRTSRTGVIGFVTDSLASGHFGGQMLRGANELAIARNHLLLTAESGGNPELEQTLVEEMVHRQVDGIIFATLAHTRREVPQALRQVPSMLLNCRDLADELPSVVPAERQAGRDAVRALLDGAAGPPIVVVGIDPNPQVVAGPQRMEGILAEIGAVGWSKPEIIDCDWNVAAAREAVSRWLSDNCGAPSLPGAMICLNDRIGMGAYQALAANSLQPGADVRLVAFDGSELCSWLQPSLASMALPFVEMGRRAVARLIERDLRGVQTAPLTLRPGESLGDQRC